MNIMTDGQLDIAQFLKGLHPFTGLTDLQVDEVARRFTVREYKAGDQVVAPDVPLDSFFIILEGEVTVTRRFVKGYTETDPLVTGDFFGAESLLNPSVSLVSALVNKPARIMVLASAQFFRLLSEFPLVYRNLMRTIEGRRLARRLQFQWLGENEVIYQIARKHEAYLLISLIGPFLLAFIALIILFYNSSPAIAPATWTTGAITSSVLFSLALLWGIWNVIDWSNDYYIVTSQRVVWVEHVIWLYDSREEAPLTTIRSVDVRTSLLGRLLGYGDVIVNVYIGRVVFRTVGQPKQMAAMIEEYWHRAERLSREEELHALEEAIQHRLERLENGDVPVIAEEPEPSSQPPRVREPNIWRNYFTNFFKMRFVEGNVITYRKFWLVLLRKTWQPNLAILTLFLLVSYLLGAYLLDRIQSPSPWQVLFLGGSLFLFVLLPWWIYHYIDWRNDIYQVTDRYIFDIERRPLGTEVKKSAPLESILSLEHERLGFLGYLFNYGNVTIYIGEARFVFLGIGDPARAQQDVFNRMNALRRKREMEQAARERDRIAEAISMYHRNIGQVDRDIG